MQETTQKPKWKCCGYEVTIDGLTLCKDGSFANGFTRFSADSELLGVAFGNIRVDKDEGRGQALRLTQDGTTAEIVQREGKWWFRSF